MGVFPCIILICIALIPLINWKTWHFTNTSKAMAFPASSGLRNFPKKCQKIGSRCILPSRAKTFGQFGHVPTDWQNQCFRVGGLCWLSFLPGAFFSEGLRLVFLFSGACARIASERKQALNVACPSRAAPVAFTEMASAAAMQLEQDSHEQLRSCFRHGK